jgi:hypothetical protein
MLSRLPHLLSRTSSKRIPERLARGSRSAVIPPSLLADAEAGGAQAQLEVAHLYGDWVDDDMQAERAAHWYAQAAQQQLPEAMYWLSLCYLHGLGVPQSLALSRKWAVRCEWALAGAASDRVRTVPTVGPTPCDKALRSERRGLRSSLAGRTRA